MTLAFRFRNYEEGRDEREKHPASTATVIQKMKKNYEMLLCKKEPQLRGGERQVRGHRAAVC